MRPGRLLAFAVAAAVSVAAVPVGAVEYRTVEAVAAILYDAPSQKGKKLYIVRQHTPLEVVVKLEGWTKVRDVEGTLAWIDSRALSDRREVVVQVGRAVVRKEPSADSAPVFEADKWVAMEFVPGAPVGWAKVKHRDGASGFVKATDVWGL